MTAGRWHRRMTRLERQMPIPAPPCPGCGYPNILLRWVVVTTGDEPVPQCPECGRPVASDRTPLVESFKHIILPKEGCEDRFVNSP